MDEENVKQKKKMGAGKGLLLAILIVFLICVVGLLVRMVIADDGDYFKPFKDIFGIEDEKESKKSNKEDKEDKTTTASSGNSSVKESARYTLLSDDVDDEDVKHYRLTVDMKKLFKIVLSEMSELNSSESIDDEDYSFDDDDFDYNFDEDDFEFDDEDLDYNFDEEDYSFDSYDDEDAFLSSDEGSLTSSLESVMGTAMMIMNTMGDMFDGEMYYDVYFEGNELIQVVFGYDYEKFARNIYDYVLENNEDSFEEQDIDSYEEFLDYMKEQMETLLDKDELYEQLMNYADEDVEDKMSQFGIKEKDIKEAIDFNCDTGLFEIYINGTTKLKALISMALESEECLKSLKEAAKEVNVKFDEDNIIETMLKIANKSDDISELGLKFVEVK